MSNEKTPMLAQLDDISSTVEGLKVCVQSQGADAEMQASLFCIWKITQELQRDLARPEVVQAYRSDAYSHINKVDELIEEWIATITDNDDTQLIAIAYAGELMVEKIRKYLQLNRPAVLKAVAAKTTEG